MGRAPYVRLVVAFIDFDNWGRNGQKHATLCYRTQSHCAEQAIAPHNRPIPEIAQAEGISEATLYNWLKQAREEGYVVPGSGKASPESWSGEAKFAVVLETDLPRE